MTRSGEVPSYNSWVRAREAEHGHDQSSDEDLDDSNEEDSESDEVTHKNVEEDTTPVPYDPFAADVWALGHVIQVMAMSSRTLCTDKQSLISVRELCANGPARSLQLDQVWMQS